MQNDRLIEQLAGNLRPVRRRSARRDLFVLATICAVELALLLALGGMRADMTAAMEEMAFWWKLGSMGLIAAACGVIAIFSFNPVAVPGRYLRWLPLLFGAALASGWMVDVSSHHSAELMARIHWQAGLQCVAEMTALSLPVALALFWLMRRGAPTDMGRSALSAGLAAGGWGAFIFAFACPHDDPLYIVIWYSVGCALVAMVVRVVLPRLARW